MPQRYVVAGDVGHRALEILRLIDKYRVKRRKQSRLAGVHSHRRNAEHGVRAKNNVRVIQIRLAPQIRVKAGARLGCLVTSYRGGRQLRDNMYQVLDKPRNRFLREFVQTLGG